MRKQNEQPFEKRLLLVGLLCTSILSFNILLPLNLDNDVFQAMGFELIRFGKLPYLGSMDQNFPGIVYIHALSILLFGNSDVAFRLLEVIIQLGSCLLLYRLTRLWLSSTEAGIACVLYCIYYVGGGYWLAGQRDGFAAFFILASTAAFLLPQKPRRFGKNFWLLVSGALISIATVIRPTYILFAVSIAVLILRYDLGEQDKKFKGLLWFILGFFIPWFCVLLPYAFHPDGLKQFYFAVIRFNEDVYGNRRLPDSIAKQIIEASAYNVPLLILALIGLIIYLRKARINEEQSTTNSNARFTTVLVSLYFLSACISVISMRKFFIYHFVPCFVLIIPFAAAAVKRITDLISKPLFRYVSLVILIAIPMGFAYPRTALPHFAQAVLQHEPHAFRNTQEGIIEDSLYGLHTERSVVHYISAFHPQRIEECAISPGIRWRSNVDQSTRFTTMLALGAETPQGGYTDFQKSWRREFIDSIRSNRPDFIILAHGPSRLLLFLVKTPSEVAMNIEGFSDLLNTSYAPDTTIGGFSIYRRR